MSYYVALNGETVGDAIARYHKSGILAASSSIWSAHMAAQFLFPVGSWYVIVTEKGTYKAHGKNTYSYWEGELNRPVPSFNDLGAAERAYLCIPSEIKRRYRS